MLTNDYQRDRRPAGRLAAPRTSTRAMAAPMDWDGALRGVLSVGFRERAHASARPTSALLETFAELAAAACATPAPTPASPTSRAPTG